MARLTFFAALVSTLHNAHLVFFVLIEYHLPTTRRFYSKKHAAW